ncbi:YukJ family protein [Granulicella arctica]|uniref:YukJ family protein n=1 Tax=Granulicella arctica TaxID=940613 RepID=UPI0021E05FFE|nr:YukJ family protein [Granulicella arctica]
MPITSYSVLRGQPTAGKVVTGSSTHYQITMQATGGPFTVAVNTESSDGSLVLYAILNKFTPPEPAALLALATGMHSLPSKAGGLALDFVREQIAGKPMVTLAEMTLLPKALVAGDHATPLKNAVDKLLDQTIADKGTIFAFGSAYSDSGKVDGIHDIHMNQGNPLASFGKDNGVWQDGALFLYLPTPKTWTAVFIAFQTESWTTDSSGNPLAAHEAGGKHHHLEG